MSSRTVGTPQRISASFPCRHTLRIRQRKHHTHLRKHHRFGVRSASFLPAVLHRGRRSGCIRDRDVCIQPSWPGRPLSIHLHMQRKRAHIATLFNTSIHHRVFLCYRHHDLSFCNFETWQLFHAGLFWRSENSKYLSLRPWSDNRHCLNALRLCSHPFSSRRRGPRHVDRVTSRELALHPAER